MRRNKTAQRETRLISPSNHTKQGQNEQTVQVRNDHDRVPYNAPLSETCSAPVICRIRNNNYLQPQFAAPRAAQVQHT